MNFGDRLKMVRNNLKREDFSQKIQIHPNTVGRWERNEQTPNVDDLNKILEVYPNINPTWLLTGEGEMKLDYVAITKDVPDAFGRVKKITYRIYEDFSSRLKKELVRPGFEYRTIEMLAQTTSLPIERVEGFFLNKAVPTVDELETLANALQVSERWLAEGYLKRGEQAPIRYLMENADGETERIQPDTVEKILDGLDRFSGEGIVLSNQHKSIIISVAYSYFRHYKKTDPDMKKFTLAYLCLLEEDSADIANNEHLYKRLDNIMETLKFAGNSAARV